MVITARLANTVCKGNTLIVGITVVLWNNGNRLGRIPIRWCKDQGCTCSRRSLGSMHLDLGNIPTGCCHNNIGGWFAGQHNSVTARGSPFGESKGCLRKGNTRLGSHIIVRDGQGMNSRGPDSIAGTLCQGQCDRLIRFIKGIIDNRDWY